MSEANNEKIVRLMAKKSFGRAKKCLLDLIEANSGETVVSNSYNKMEEAFNKLEKAHVEYLQAAKIDIDVDDAEANYLDNPGAEKMSAEVEYRKYIQGFEAQKKMQKDKKKFNSELAALLSSMESFGKPSEYISQLCESKLISHDDMREEVKKIEEKVDKLIEGKKNLASLDPTADLNDIRNRLENGILKEVQESKKKATIYIYDSDHVQDKKKFKLELAAFEASMDNFGKPSANIAHLCHSKIASHDAIMEEVKLMEEKLDKLLENKRRLVSLDPTADLSDIRNRLENDIMKDVQEAKKNAMIYITTSDLMQTPPYNCTQSPNFDHEQTHISENTSTHASINVSTPTSENLPIQDHVYTTDYITGGKVNDVKRPSIKPTMTGTDFFIFIGDWETYKESKKIETKSIPLELYRAADDDLKKLLEKKKLLKKFSARTEKQILDLYRSLTVQDKFRPRNLIQMIDLTGIKAECIESQENVLNEVSANYAKSPDPLQKNKNIKENNTEVSPVWKVEEDKNYQNLNDEIIDGNGIAENIDRIITGTNANRTLTNNVEEETVTIASKRKRKDKQLDGRKVAKGIRRVSKEKMSDPDWLPQISTEQQRSLRNIRNIKEVTVGNTPKRTMPIKIKKCPDEIMSEIAKQTAKQSKEHSKQRKNSNIISTNLQKKVKVSSWLDSNRKDSIYKKHYKQKNHQIKEAEVSFTSRIRTVSKISQEQIVYNDVPEIRISSKTPNKKAHLSHSRESQSQNILGDDEALNNDLSDNQVSTDMEDPSSRQTRLSVRLRKRNQSWSVASSPSRPVQ